MPRADQTAAWNFEADTTLIRVLARNAEIRKVMVHPDARGLSLSRTLTRCPRAHQGRDAGPWRQRKSERPVCGLAGERLAVGPLDAVPEVERQRGRVRPELPARGEPRMVNAVGRGVHHERLEDGRRQPYRPERR